MNNCRISLDEGRFQGSALLEQMLADGHAFVEVPASRASEQAISHWKHPEHADKLSLPELIGVVQVCCKFLPALASGRP